MSSADNLFLHQDLASGENMWLKKLLTLFILGANREPIGSVGRVLDSRADPGFLERGFICIKVCVCVCVCGGGGGVRGSLR